MFLERFWSARNVPSRIAQSHGSLRGTSRDRSRGRCFNACMHARIWCSSPPQAFRSAVRPGGTCSGCGEGPHDFAGHDGILIGRRLDVRFMYLAGSWRSVHRCRRRRGHLAEQRLQHTRASSRFQDTCPTDRSRRAYVQVCGHGHTHFGSRSRRLMRTPHGLAKSDRATYAGCRCNADQLDVQSGRSAAGRAGRHTSRKSCLEPPRLRMFAAMFQKPETHFPELHEAQSRSVRLSGAFAARFGFPPRPERGADSELGCTRGFGFASCSLHSRATRVALPPCLPRQSTRPRCSVSNGTCMRVPIERESYMCTDGTQALVFRCACTMYTTMASLWSDMRTDPCQTWSLHCACGPGAPPIAANASPASMYHAALLLPHVATLKLRALTCAGAEGAPPTLLTNLACTHLASRAVLRWEHDSARAVAADLVVPTRRRRRRRAAAAGRQVHSDM